MEVATLQRLAQPFIDEGAKKLFFSAAEGRVYVGREPPDIVEGCSDAPEVLEVDIHPDRAFGADLLKILPQLRELIK